MTSVFASAVIGNRTGIAAYQKKPVFGPAAVTLVSTLLMQNGNDFLVDTSSTISLHGVGRAEDDIPEGVSGTQIVETHLDALYREDGSGIPEFKGPASSLLAEGLTYQGTAPTGLFRLPDLRGIPVGLVNPGALPR